MGIRMCSIQAACEITVNLIYVIHASKKVTCLNWVTKPTNFLLPFSKMSSHMEAPNKHRCSVCPCQREKVSPLSHSSLAYIQKER